MTTLSTSNECPSSQEPINVGNRGNGGTASKTVACGCSPLLNVWGTGGNTNMFLNISVFDFTIIWLSMFPKKIRGEQNPPLKAPETLAVPTVPPFPRFFSRDTYGQWSNQAEVTT